MQDDVGAAGIDTLGWSLQMNLPGTRVAPFMILNRFVLFALRRRVHGKQQSCWVVCLQLLSGQRPFALGEAGSYLAPTLLMFFEGSHHSFFGWTWRIRQQVFDCLVVCGTIYVVM